MDNLRGIIFIQSTYMSQRLCLALEDPNDTKLVHVIICKERKINTQLFVHKRKHILIFKSYNFLNIEKVTEFIGTLEDVTPRVPEPYIQHISLNSLKKLNLDFLNNEILLDKNPQKIKGGL